MLVKYRIQNTAFSTNKTLNVQGQLIDLSTPRVMGILNVTPDSFFDGGKYRQEVEILKQVEKMLLEGATFIDIGGYSSRPGAADVPVSEETARTVAAVKVIKREFNNIILSVDTFRSEVASASIQEGASLINDISSGELDPEMPGVVAKYNVPYIIMHMRGTPQTMNTMTSYENLVKEVIDFFHRKIKTLHDEGIKDVIVDPGFGFAKTPRQNFSLLNHLDYFEILNRPLLVGLSNKSMIWRTLNVEPQEALNGTTVLNTIAILKKADIIRVHQVREAVQVIKLVHEMNDHTPGQ